MQESLAFQWKHSFYKTILFKDFLTLTEDQKFCRLQDIASLQHFLFFLFFFLLLCSNRRAQKFGTIHKYVAVASLN